MTQKGKSHIGVSTRDENYLDELAELARTAGALVVAGLSERASIDARYYTVRFGGLAFTQSLIDLVISTMNSATPR